MFDAEAEVAFILSLLPRLGMLADPRYESIQPSERAAEALNWLTSEEVVLIHIDAGSRTLEIPGSPVSMVKLAVYVTEFKKTGPETAVYYPVYQWKTSTRGIRSSNILYVRGDYRVRQALSYLVEIAGLYSSMKRYVRQGRLVIGYKDGPLIQQIGQYLTRSYNLSSNVALYALRYAGLDPSEVTELIQLSTTDGEVNAGLLMLQIIEKLRGLTRYNAYPAGVVEDTSRSRSLITWLIADAMVEALSKVSAARGLEAINVANQLYLNASVWLVQNLKSFLGKCICWTWINQVRIYQALIGVLNSVVEGIESALVTRKRSYNLDALKAELQSGKKDEALLSIIRGILLGQVFENLATRDPDIVMLAYYLDVLKSYVTKPVPRLGPLESAQDAINRWKREQGELIDTAWSLVGSLSNLKMRYVITDPPMTCSAIEKELQSKQIAGTLAPCEVASLDTYQYAPPVRLEFFKEPEPGRVTDVVLLESLVAKYKFPLGILVADKASRVTMAEALTARPLERRLIPLRYYIRSWEKRLEYL